MTGKVIGPSVTRPTYLRNSRTTSFGPALTTTFNGDVAAFS